MKIHFLCKFNIQPHLDTLEYGRQNSICWNLKKKSKYPDLSKILPPILDHIKPYRPSTKQLLYVNHYETPCTSIKSFDLLFFQKEFDYKG